MPLQIYCAGLSFALETCVRFEGELHPWMFQLPNMSEIWGVELQILEDPLSPINSVTFSPTGQILAFFSEDETIRFWNVVTGAVHRMRPFNRIPERIRFFADGSYLIFNMGVLHVQSQCDKHKPKSPQAGLEIFIDDDHWIQINNKVALPLSVEFRLHCFVVYGNRVAMGHKFGQISVMGFHLGHQEHIQEN